MVHRYIAQAQMEREGKHTRDALYTPLTYRHHALHMVKNGVHCLKDHSQYVAEVKENWGEGTCW